MLKNKKKLAGIWVDHTNAWIVRYDKSNESIEKVESQMEPRVKETGGTAEARVAHHKIENRREEYAKKFYQEILTKIGDVDELVLMGPSTAKTELKKCVAKKKALHAKLRGTIPADHMSDRQIAAKVREYFHLGNDLAAA